MLVSNIIKRTFLNLLRLFGYLADRFVVYQTPSIVGKVANQPSNCCWKLPCLEK